MIKDKYLTALEQENEEAKDEKEGNGEGEGGGREEEKEEGVIVEREEDEVDLRRYRPAGGPIVLSILELPPPPKSVGQWTIRRGVERCILAFSTLSHSLFLSLTHSLTLSLSLSHSLSLSLTLSPLYLTPSTHIPHPTHLSNLIHVSIILPTHPSTHILTPTHTHTDSHIWRSTDVHIPSRALQSHFSTSSQST